jgi:hypothetical protein
MLKPYANSKTWDVVAPAAVLRRGDDIHKIIY